MASDTFKLTIRVPEKEVYSDEVSFLKLPTKTGEVGVTPSHTRAFFQLKSGDLIVESQKNTYFLVNGGYVKVTPNYVNIVTEGIENALDINVEEESKEVQHLKDELLGNLTDERRAELQLKLETLEHRLSLAQLALKQAEE